MVELLVIADDFTGALDTGVQFKTKEARIRVVDGENQPVLSGLDSKIQVLIVDTETRHMSPQAAYQKVYRIVSEAVGAGVPCIYKKTDSGLRGNIGSELAGMLDASGQERVHFVPAFPQMGRRTVGGVHYINGTPVAQSVFGVDPFEPVRCSSIAEIIASQSPVETHQMGARADGELPCGVLVYDSSTERDLERIAQDLKRQRQLHLLAGCAGFASVLPALLNLTPGGGSPPEFREDLLMVCGSVSPITIRQMDEAEEKGARRIRMRLDQKLDAGWLDTVAGKRCLADWMAQIEESRCTILESASSVERETVQQYADRTGVPRDEIRSRISNTMGAVLKRLLDRGLRRTMLITGGDTLMAVMAKLQLNELSPVCQIFPGVVLSEIRYRGNAYNLISKSGGFGESNLLVDLEKMIRNSMKEKWVC